MGWLTYQEYIVRYPNDNISQQSYPRLAALAAGSINAYTCGRASRVDASETGVITVLADLQAELIHQRTGWEASDAAHGTGVSGFSNDGYSESYTGADALKASRDAAERQLIASYFSDPTLARLSFKGGVYHRRGR